MTGLWPKPRIVVLWAVAAAIALAAAPSAAADPALPVAGGGPADEAIQQLESAGYEVSATYLEGRPNVPLSQCRLTGISTFGGGTMTSDSVMMMLMDPAEVNTAYVDVDCPNAK